MEHIRVVLISAPRDVAAGIAKSLVEERLAACVNVIPKMESYFRWDDAVQHDDEALLIVKTTQQCFDDLLIFVRENHPYDLPEVIALPLVNAFADYVDWVKSETRPGE